ncbi:MAG: nuclear transport factor 2 family protein [Haliea sp.]|jgi:uncharacterized protein|nr:nuclear transport factor 2 family protein [Haliea sp.]MDP4789186.1 nuclear transport factor 2 family protein [Haliea sp.]MDP5064081.1 nuclear transport factor 2 family protein [Haliea sp.]
MTTETDNKARVRQFLSDLSAGNVNAVVAAYAKNGSVETMGATLISGTTDFTDLQQAISSIIQVFPQGLRFTIHGMVAEGEKVAVEASSEGEHSSGQTYSNDYHFLFEFDKGLLVKLTEYMDTEQVTDVLCGGQRPPYPLD